VSSAVRMAPVARQVAGPVWTTPEILKGGVVSIWIASALLMAAEIAGARSHRHANHEIGVNSAPSIIAAQHIRAALADMDANAASDHRPPG